MLWLLCMLGCIYVFEDDILIVFSSHCAFKEVYHHASVDLMHLLTSFICTTTPSIFDIYCNRTVIL